MCKRPRFRRTLNKSHDKRSETLFKTELLPQLPQLFMNLKQLSWKRSLLVIWKILGLFVNTLTADDKYFFLNRDIFHAINSDTII